MLSQEALRTLEILDDLKLTQYEFRTLHHIMRCLQETGTYDRAIGHAAEHLGMSEGTYRKVMKSLTQQGYVKLVKEGGRGFGARNEYAAGDTLHEVLSDQ